VITALFKSLYKCLKLTTNVFTYVNKSYST